MSTSVCVNGSIQFTFFLVIRLNITTVTSCDWLMIIFFSLKLENRLWKHVQNVPEIKYGFVKLVVIFLTS